MAASSAQRVIDELADQLQRSVVIDDPAVRLLYASRHFGDEDDVRTHAVLQRQASSDAVGHVLAQGVAGWTTPGVIPPNEAIGMLARVCYPIRWRGDLLGLLLVLDADGSITTSELSAISAAGEAVAPILAGERTSDPDGSAARRAQAVNDLLAGTDVVRRAALRALALEDVDLAAFERVRVVTLQVDDVGDAVAASDAHVATALDLALAAAGVVPGSPAVLTAVHGRRGSVVLGSRPRVAEEGLALDLGARLAGKVAEVAAGRFDCRAGVGGEVAGLERAWASAEQSVLACRAAREGGEQIRSWASLGALAVLLRLGPEPLPVEALPAELQRVLAADPDRRLLSTLRAYLDHAGAIPATARDLHVHRTTLYYRLEKLSTAADIDLDDGETRLALHLGLRLMDRPDLLRA